MDMVTPSILQLLRICLIILALDLQGSEAQAVSPSPENVPVSPLERNVTPISPPDPPSPSNSNASESIPPLALPPPRPAPAPDIQGGTQPFSGAPVNSLHPIAPRLPPLPLPENASPPPSTSAFTPPDGASTPPPTASNASPTLSPPPKPVIASPSLPVIVPPAPPVSLSPPPSTMTPPPVHDTAPPPINIHTDVPSSSPSSQPFSNVSPPSSPHNNAPVSKSPFSVPVSTAPAPIPSKHFPQTPPNAMGKAPSAVPVKAPSTKPPQNASIIPNIAPIHANPVNSSTNLAPVPEPVSSGPSSLPSRNRISNSSVSLSPRPSPANNVAPTAEPAAPVAPRPKLPGEKAPPPVNPGLTGSAPFGSPDHSNPPTISPSPGINRTNRKPVAAQPKNVSSSLPPSSHFPREASPPATAPASKSTHHSVASPPTLKPGISPSVNEYHPSAPPPENLFHGQHRGNKIHRPIQSHRIAPISPRKRGSTRDAPSPSISDSLHSPASSPPSSGPGWNEISPPLSSPSSPKVSTPPPIRGLPPPPPNIDCTNTICTEPYTNTPPGSPCGCVWPMQVGLRLGVALYTFFPLVSEFAGEIASGVFMKASQVRIMGANSASEQDDKTDVLINLVPLGEKFDNTTALLTYRRFWHKVVLIKASLFVDYEVLYVRYPGLPASPPFNANVIGSRPNSNINGSLIKPMGVALSKKRHGNRLSGGMIAIIALSSSVAALLCVAFVWVLFYNRRSCASDHEALPTTSVPPILKPSGSAGSALGSGPSFNSLSIESVITPYAGSAKTFSASDIEKATNHLDTSFVLGEGGFGRVYSGILEDGSKVAVKVLKRDDQQGSREFLAEVEMLSRLHHRNLVNLIGICTEERLRCLVYELVPNGSVESHLHGVDKESAPLNWEARLKIALGAARGLAYLHEDSSPRVIHRDFKSSNILLEKDFTPKVSDFGLARTGMEEENRHISTRVMGTFGYVAPEYAMTGHLLVKSDVYSYGVVLLELLTGRKPIDMLQPAGQENLVAWARPLLTSQEGLEGIVDQSLKPDVPSESLAKVAAIASMCVQPEVSHRPFMGEVVQALKLVCSECDDAKVVLSRNSSFDNLSDKDTRAASSSRLLIDPLHGRYSPSGYDSEPETERRLVTSELMGVSSRFDSQRSESFRMLSSSGPVGEGGSRPFWQRGRGLSGGGTVEDDSKLGLRQWSH